MNSSKKVKVKLMQRTMKDSRDKAVADTYATGHFKHYTIKKIQDKSKGNTECIRALQTSQRCNSLSRSKWLHQNVSL